MSIRKITKSEKVIGQNYDNKIVIRFGEPESKSKLSCWIEYSNGEKENCSRDVIGSLWHHWLMSEGVREDDENYTIFAYYQGNYDLVWKYKMTTFGDNIKIKNMNDDDLFKFIESAIRFSKANSVKAPMTLISNSQTIGRQKALRIINHFDDISEVQIDEDSPRDIIYLKNYNSNVDKK